MRWALRTGNRHTYPYVRRGQRCGSAGWRETPSVADSRQWTGSVPETGCPGRGRYRPLRWPAGSWMQRAVIASGGSARRWTASDLRAGWQPAAGAVATGADSWAVVSRSSWPSRSWMVRRSVPASSRCVAQLWRIRCGETLLPMPARLRGFAACTPHDLVRDGLLGVAMQAGGKQIGARLEPAPVGAQRLQQRRAQGQIAVLAALAVDHVDDHALAVDVADLQPGDSRRGACRCRREPSAGCARNRFPLALISRATSSWLRMPGSRRRSLG